MRGRKKRRAEARAPGPPSRPRNRRERAAKRIWVTLVGRAGRAWDTWIEDPTGNGVKLTPPWDDREQHFKVGEGEGAYDIVFDEDRGTRRLPALYEDMPTAPVFLERGNWQSVEDMSEANESFIRNLDSQRTAELQEVGEGFPVWGWALVIIAIVSAVSHVLSVALG